MLCAVVSCGALGNLSDAMTLMNEVPKLVKMRNNQLEEFCTYRVINILLISAHFILQYSDAVGSTWLGLDRSSAMKNAAATIRKVEHWEPELIVELLWKTGKLNEI